MSSSWGPIRGSPDEAALISALAPVLGSMIAPIAFPDALTPCAVLETLSATMKYSAPSRFVSLWVETLNVRVSPAVPVKAMAAVLAV